MPWVFQQSVEEFIAEHGGRGTERRLLMSDGAGGKMLSDVILILPDGSRINTDTGQRETDVGLAKLEAERRYLESAKYALNLRFRAVQNHITACCATHASEGGAMRWGAAYNHAFEQAIEREAEKLEILKAEGVQLDALMAAKDREIAEHEQRTGELTASTIAKQMAANRAAATASAQRALAKMYGVLSP